MSGFIYFLRCGDFIKIGYSASPKVRTRDLDQASPYPIEVIATWPGTFQQEKMLHQRFGRYKAKSEWFRAVPSILETAATGDIPEIPARPSVPAMEQVRAEISRIEVLLKKRRVSLRQMCREAGIAPSTWTRWKSGKASPTVSTLSRCQQATSSLLDGVSA